MVCFAPLLAYRLSVPVGVVSHGKNRPLSDSFPKVVFNVPPGLASLYIPISLPCGQCSGCKTKRALQWAVRCVHESKLWPSNCFITLTFDSAHLPPYNSLDVRHWQLFMKRLKSAVRRKYGKKAAAGIRFYHCGEYGTKNGRPHYHACLFNFDFPDRVFFKKTATGDNLYTSKFLEAVWPFGFSTVGDVTVQSAFYVAQYCQDKLNLSAASPEAMHDVFHAKYDYVLPTGHIATRRPEYATMSRNPGIGRGAYDKWSDDWFSNDFVISNGTKIPIPRYYNGLYDIDDPDAMHLIKLKRVDTAKKLVSDNTPERLAVRKAVADARRNLVQRNGV